MKIVQSLALLFHFQTSFVIVPFLLNPVICSEMTATFDLPKMGGNLCAQNNLEKIQRFVTASSRF